jgi:xanthine dehydrogenase iron-sulfur cluster and FAD-binding subunit A
MTLSYTHQVAIAVRVNDREVRTDVSPRTSLLDWLREELGLTGKKGCNEGACGTCTVLVDGRRMSGCLALAVQCDGRDVTTVEGLAAADGARTTSSRPSTTMTPSSAGTARRGSCCRRPPASRKATPSTSRVRGSG